MELYLYDKRNSFNFFVRSMSHCFFNLHKYISKLLACLANNNRYSKIEIHKSLLHLYKSVTPLVYKYANNGEKKLLCYCVYANVTFENVNLISGTVMWCTSCWFLFWSIRYTYLIFLILFSLYYFWLIVTQSFAKKSTVFSFLL